MAPFTIPMQDMVRILSHGGGSKNLEAATAYLARLFIQRTGEREALLRDAQALDLPLAAEHIEQQVEHAMAPFTIPMQDMVKILANNGGSKNLEAATAYLERLFIQRTGEREALLANAQALGLSLAAEHIEQQVEHAMAPFTIPMQDMVRILSHDGGSLRLNERLQELNFQ